MNTYNVAIIFDDAYICTIVCHSSQAIDVMHVRQVVAETVNSHSGTHAIPDTVASNVCIAITQKCNCQAVVVKSDAVLAVKRIPINPQNQNNNQ